jgi:hypothetical protein
VLRILLIFFPNLFQNHPVYGFKIKERWDREQRLKDQVELLIFVANTGESSSEFDLDDDSFFICLWASLYKRN